MIWALFEVAAMMRPHVERAERLRVLFPIRYRMAGHEHWLDSRICDISESGVLFGPAIVPPEPGTRVEVMFSSPVQIGTLPPGQMMCAGEVIRMNERGQIGARFAQCRFVLDDLPATASERHARQAAPKF
jgi:PilZ domain-containing protein